MANDQQRSAGAAPRFSVRHVHSPTDAYAAMDVVTAIWGGPAGIDANTLIALTHSDNYVALAELGNDVVGVGIGFCGPPAARTLHSHIVGATVPGAGRAIKGHQRAWSAERGIDTITWTFDPLVARNAWFNLGVLGARIEQYLVDHYGPMDDGLNAGQPSDRLLVSWPVAPPAPTHSPPSEAPPSEAPPSEAPPSEAPPTAAPQIEPTARIRLPADLEQLRRTDPGSALDWRLRVREEFRAHFGRGDGVLGFAREVSGRGGSYLLGPTGRPPSYHPAADPPRPPNEQSNSERDRS